MCECFCFFFFFFFFFFCFFIFFFFFFFFFFAVVLFLVKAILRKELPGIEVEKLNAENIVSVARA